MNDKIVTHRDLPTLQDMRKKWRGGPLPEFDLLHRLIEAAEADKPALPEGWVLRRGGAVHWHQDGCLYNNPDSLVMTYSSTDVIDQIQKDALTPLRPLITEADVSRAYEALHAEDVQHAPWATRLRAAFAAAGVEVQG